jgi:hypothetical protein
MKNILKFLAISVLLSSCGDFEPVIFDPDTGQTLVFFSSTTSALQVVVEDTGSVDVKIGVNTLSSMDRTVTIAVNPSPTLTTAAAENYTVPTTVVIPAGEYFGVLTITGVDNSVETTPEIITINIVSIEGGGQVSSTNHTISIFQICPITAAFTGNYFLQQLTAINPDDGVKMFNDQVVNIISTGATTRSFKAKYLEALGIGQPDSTIPFGLVCNEVIVAPGIGTGLSCGGTPAITLGPANVPANYDADDDSVFELTLTEYVTDGGCGAAPYQTTFRLTKQ